MESDLNRVKELDDMQKRRFYDVMSSILNDLAEVGNSLGNKEQVRGLLLIVFLHCE